MRDLKNLVLGGLMFLSVNCGTFYESDSSGRKFPPGTGPESGRWELMQKREGRFLTLGNRENPTPMWSEWVEGIPIGERDTLKVRYSHESNMIVIYGREETYLNEYNLGVFMDKNSINKIKNYQMSPMSQENRRLAELELNSSIPENSIIFKRIR